MEMLSTWLVHQAAVENPIGLGWLLRSSSKKCSSHLVGVPILRQYVAAVQCVVEM